MNKVKRHRCKMKNLLRFLTGVDRTRGLPRQEKGRSDGHWTSMGDCCRRPGPVRSRTEGSKGTRTVHPDLGGRTHVWGGEGATPRSSKEVENHETKGGDIYLYYWNGQYPKSTPSTNFITLVESLVRLPKSTITATTGTSFDTDLVRKILCTFTILHLTPLGQVGSVGHGPL